MKKSDISLEPHETELFQQIMFDPDAFDAADQAIRNGESVLELLKSLDKRKAIPEQRLRYFIDPEYNIGGRGKSKLDIFEKNGTHGNDIFRHPHFLYYFEYFLFGPDLPDKLKEEFLSEVRSCGNITSGDVGPLSKWARQATRKYNLDPRSTAEEFFKLAIECGINTSYASYIRTAVMKIK